MGRSRARRGLAATVLGVVALLSLLAGAAVPVGAQVGDVDGAASASSTTSTTSLTTTTSPTTTTPAPPSAPVAPSAASVPAPTATATGDEVVRVPDAVPGKYIVTLDPGVDAPSAAAPLSDAVGAEVTEVYDRVLTGFAVDASDDEARALAEQPGVARVVEDSYVRADTVQSPTPSWGLDRIDQDTLPLDQKYHQSSDGRGVTAYVLDTGVRLTHTDLVGRAQSGWDFVDNDPDASVPSPCPGDQSGSAGHGTHVAGTIAGTQHGVAKAARVVSVRVLGCSGTGFMSSVVSALEWVEEQAVLPSVVNLSLSTTGTSPEAGDALKSVVDAGHTVAVAAGNVASDACGSAPGNVDVTPGVDPDGSGPLPAPPAAPVPGVLTAGSTTQSDARSSFSNYGPCVDLFAPGSGIRSAWYLSDTATATLSGTSMAAPHVAGVAAQLLSRTPGLTPADVATAIVGGATPGVVGDPGTDSPNLLLSSDLLPPLAPDGPVVMATPWDSAVRLTWGEPFDHGGSITGYDVYRGPDASTLSLLATVPPSPLAYTDPRPNGTTTFYRVDAVNAAGTTPSQVVTGVAKTSTGAFFPLVPARVLDTRTGNGAPLAKVGPQSTIALTLVGRGGVPSSGVDSVVLNVTATAGSSSSHVRAWPDDVSPMPDASILNFDPGATVPNLVTVPIGSGGGIKLYNDSGQVDLVADVVGWYADGTVIGPSGARFHAIDPKRVFDSRGGQPWGPGQSLAVPIVGDHVPAGATAVVANVTAVDPSGTGFATVYPNGISLPLASNLNFVPGQTVPNLVAVPLGTDGKVKIHNSAGSTHFLVDIVGYYDDGSAPAPLLFVSHAPTRMLDSRYGTGVGATPWMPNQSRNVTLATSPVPSFAVAVIGNLTAVAPGGVGFVSAFPAGSSTDVSNLNLRPGVTVANLAVPKLGTGGAVTLFNGSFGTTHLLFDATGWFVPEGLVGCSGC